MCTPKFAVPPLQILSIRENSYTVFVYTPVLPTGVLSELQYVRKDKL